MTLSRDEYVACLQGLLSRDPIRIRDANRVLFTAVVNYPVGDSQSDPKRGADLVLAEVAAG